jgi:TonB family protein
MQHLGKIIIVVLFSMVAMRVVAGPVLTREEATKLEVYTPMPVYPMAARISRIKGNGTFILRIRTRTGLVKDVRVEHSTGETLLDYAAIRALKKWRFKPGALPSIKMAYPQSKDAFATEDSLIRVPVYFVMRH